MGRLRDERLMLKSTVPVLEFPAVVVVPVRLPTEVTELLISGRKQNCPPILGRLILSSLVEHEHPQDSAKGVVHPPLLHQECFPLSLSSLLSLNLTFPPVLLKGSVRFSTELADPGGH